MSDPDIIRVIAPEQPQIVRVLVGSAFFGDTTFGTITRNLERSITEFGVPVGSTDEVATTRAFNDAIEAINADELQVLKLLGGTWNIGDGVLNAITGSKWKIEGNGASIQIPSDGGTLGRFFVIGDLATRSSFGYLDEVYLVCQNTPDVNEFAIDVVDATELFMSRIRPSAACALRVRADAVDVNSDPLSTLRLTLTDWMVDANKAAGCENIVLFKAGSRIMMEDWTIAARQPFNVNPNCAGIRFKPGLNHAMDTIELLNVSCQCWLTTTPVEAADGLPFIIDLDLTEARIVNFASLHGTLDHATVAATRCIAPGAIDTIPIRNHKHFGNRSSSDNGRNLVYKIDNPLQFMRSLVVRDNTYYNRGAGPFIDVEVADLGQGEFANLIGDLDSVTAVPFAVRYACSNFRSANDIGQGQRTPFFDTAVKIDDPDADNFEVNDHAPGVLRYLSEPAYTNPSGSRQYPGLIARTIRSGGVADLLDVPRLADLGGAAFMSAAQIRRFPETAVSGTPTLVNHDGHKAFRATASVTMTLPAASECDDDWEVMLKGRGGAITLSAAGTDTIDGGTSITVADGSAKRIIRTSATTFEGY
jgi:hypothetical protein